MEKEIITIVKPNKQTRNPAKKNKQKRKFKPSGNKKLLNRLNALNIRTPKKMMGVPNLKSFMNTVTSYQHSYARAVVIPEYAKGAKIPSIFPQPTASLHKHITVPIVTNASGKAAILWNPFFLSDTSYNRTQLLLDNAVGLDLINSELVSGYTAIKTDFGIPINIINTYRLVSASMTIVPQMSIQTAQGSIGGGVYQIGSDLSAAGYVAASTGIFVLPQMTVAANIDNLLYFKKANLTALESIRHIYFPLDPSYEIYVKGNSSHGINDPTDFVFAYYITGAPASANFNLELYVNYEYIPNVYAQSFIPMDTYSGNEKPENIVQALSQNEVLTSQAATNINNQLNDIIILRKI